MAWILSNYGHRIAVRSSPLAAPEEARFLSRLLEAFVVQDSPPAGLEAQGLVQRVPDGTDPNEIALRYARNPIEHMRRVVFEYTTVCNLDCRHCRNGSIEAVSETDPVKLRRVVDAALPLGIERFDFIGGEVTRYGKGWLDLVSYARSQGASHTSVITNGWFFGRRDFTAAGKRYADDHSYLADLRERGLTHVVVSLDGPEEVHDACREVPGLYRRILTGLDAVRAAGLVPRVSVVVGLSEGVRQWLADLSRRIYGPTADEARLVADDSSYVSHLIDIGAGSSLVSSSRRMSDWSDASLRCKNFFRPSPTLRIKATGELALCPLVEGGEGYGNVHHRDIVEILNHLQEAPLYKLHAERRLDEARRLVDPEIFDGHVGHACTARVAVNMVALAAAARGVGPGDTDALRAINEEVAQKMGILPRLGIHRANGHDPRG